VFGREEKNNKEEDMRFRAVIFVGLVSALTFGIDPMLPSPAAAQAEVKPADILVNGIGEVTVTPNTVYISLGVSTRGGEAAETSRRNAEKTSAVLKAIAAHDIPDDDVRTDDYRLEGVEDSKNGALFIKGYEVSNTIRITVRTVAKAGAVLDSALKAGANTVGGVSFSLADPQKAEDDALVKAIEDATRKAKIAAKAASFGAIRLQQIRLGGAYDTEYSLPGYASSRTALKSGRQTIKVVLSAQFVAVERAPVIIP
jgi:uncharacterized protein YggE